MGRPFDPSGLLWRSRLPSSANGHQHGVGVVSSGYIRSCRSGVQKSIGVRCIWCRFGLIEAWLQVSDQRKAVCEFTEEDVGVWVLNGLQQVV